MIVKFDPKRKKFQLFPKAEFNGALHAGGVVDSKGNVWASEYNGALRLNLGQRFEPVNSPLAGSDGGLRCIPTPTRCLWNQHSPGVERPH